MMGKKEQHINLKLSTISEKIFFSKARTLSCPAYVLLHWADCALLTRGDSMDKPKKAISSSGDPPENITC